VWNNDVFLPTVGKRGAAIIEARGLSSAASAANAAIDHMRDWVLGTNGKWSRWASRRTAPTAFPKDVMFGFPVTTKTASTNRPRPGNRRLQPGKDQHHAQGTGRRA
jgi:malate dehydrogenase